jgi:hypothetical protein
VSPRRIALWVLAAFAIWWIVQNPVQAAHLVRHGGNGVSHVTHSTSTFVNGVAGGH